MTGLVESSTSASSSCALKDEGSPSTQPPALPEVSTIQRGTRRGDSLWYQRSPDDGLAVAYSGLLRSTPTIELPDPQLFDAFIVDLKPSLIWTRAWFREINDVRHDQTYDEAFRALARIHCAKALGDPALLSHGRYAYGCSLNSLRKKIETSVGTDVAFLQNIVIVLSVYEFYDACLSNKSGQITLQNVEASNYPRENWIHHASAIATIMKILGPGPYTKDPAVEFAFAVMRDTMGGVSFEMANECVLTLPQIMLAYKRGTSCFLDEPRWQAVIRPEVSTGIDYCISVTQQVHVCGPRLLHEANVLTRVSSPDPAAILRLCERVSKLKVKAIEAFELFWQTLKETSNLPVEVSNQTGTVPQNFYCFEGVILGETLVPRDICHHYCLKINLNRILIQHDPSLSPEQRSLLRQEDHSSSIEICKCIPTLEQMPVSLIGIFALSYKPFFLKAALLGCHDVEYIHWLEAKLKEFL